MNRRTKLISIVVSILSLSAVVYAQAHAPDAAPTLTHGDEVSPRLGERNQAGFDEQTLEA
jgi:hypothetical protein